VVPMSHVLRVAHIAPDFAELTLRCGVKALPARHTSPLADQRAMRLLDNYFFRWDIVAMSALFTFYHFDHGPPRQPRP